MPRSRQLTNYPEEFWLLCEHAGSASTDKVYRLDLPSTRAALSLQAKFYAFRRALQIEATRLTAAPESAWKIRVQNTLVLCNQVACYIDRDCPTPNVSFMNRSRTPEAQLLRQLLATGGEPTLEQELAESAARLKEQTQQEGENGGKYG